MKRWIALLLAVVMGLSACGNGANKDEKNQTEQDQDMPKAELIDKQFSGKTLKVTSFTKDMEYAVRAFEQAYACKVELTVKDRSEWEKEPSAVMQDQADVYTLEANDLETWLNSDVLLPLTDVSAENYAAYTTALATDQAGELKALTWSVTPINLYYRRSIAKTVLGDDSPEAVGAALSGIQAALDFSVKLQSAGYKLFSNAEDMKAFYQATDKTERNILSAEEQFFLTSVKQMQTDYRLAGLQTWSPDWFKGMYGKAANPVTGKNIDVFGYVMPSWGKSYVLEKAGDDTESTEAVQNPTWGDWGMTVCPTPGFSEGIWLGIAKNSQQAEMAKAFLVYVTQNQALLDSWLERTKELPAFLPILESYAESREDSFLGGQKAMELYLQTVKDIPAKSAQEIRLEKEYYEVLAEFFKGSLATLEEVQAKLANPVPAEAPAAPAQ